MTADVTRAVADFFDEAAAISAEDAVAVCQDASGLLYLNSSGSTSATAVASLVRIGQILLIKTAQIAYYDTLRCIKTILNCTIVR